MTCPVRDGEWGTWGDCPLFLACRRLFADGGKCWKYDRPCGNAEHCIDWGYECDSRYADYD